ncbi:MAG: ATP-binding protein [Paludibacteraceae bacterium]|nr:ATP-binding protein [Paludibacteraceae bacterium]
MESLFATSQLLISRVDTTYVRDKHDDIDWNSRLVAILGARGTGKTTMILQHIRLHNTNSQALYVMADDFYFTSHRLEELAHKFMLLGGKYLYIDEIHKYKGWSTEIKNIYDKMPDLHVVYSGSSILDLEKGGADLSRRKLEYIMPGLSFREYLNISQGWNLPRYTLEEILAGKVDFPYKEARPLQLFASYLREGYYPFFKEGNYTMRLNGIIKQVVEDDVPKFADMEIASVQKLKKLLYILAQNVPFKPNYAKLERDLGISRNTLPKYMQYLEKAGLIGVLREKVQGIKLLEKIEKIYLNNPNEAYILSDETPNIGTLRETIFFAWLRVEHLVSSSPVSDFEVDGLTFEIGGKNKGKKQLATLPSDKAYVVKDDTEYVFQNFIPLWMFGFVY